MIQNLITACLIATANVTIPNITTKEKPLETPTVETRELIFGIERVGETADEDILYYFDGKQHQHTQYYDIDTVWLRYAWETNHYYISFYTVITPLTEDRPTQNIALYNEMIITGEEECTLNTRRATQYNVENKDNIYLNLENLKQTAYDDLMQNNSFTYGAWTTRRIDYNYFSESIDYTESINVSQTMEDGKIRYSAIYEIQADAEYINPRPESTNLVYYYYVQPIEVVDIGGLMWQILGMPFSFISQAFNLTIFQGTPYAVNISQLLFTIIGSLLLIIVVKKVIK